MTSKKSSKAVHTIVREMNASSEELAGEILSRSQTIETLITFHIVRRDPTKTLESLDGRTFGQLLQMFRRHSQDQELNDWLETLRQLRNDIAHSFFVDQKVGAAELGKEAAEALIHLNHKVLRKGLRITEICHAGLKNLVESNDGQPDEAKRSD